MLIWSIPHQGEAQLSKLVNKGTCWEKQNTNNLPLILQHIYKTDTLTLIQTHTHTHTHTDSDTQMHRQTDRHYLNSSGAKCQMSSDPSGPILNDITQIM